MTALSLFSNPLLKADLLARVTEEVADVHHLILEATESRSPMVERVVRHTLDAGGKRLRPAFVWLAARAVDPGVSADRLHRLGACMEMVHMATLIHDDVVDNSATRRGKPTAGIAFGNTASILTGDVLLAKAMQILADDGDPEIIRTVSRAVVEMAEGEVQELELRGDFDVEESIHMEVLHLKTAAFIRCCCEIGALAAGATRVQREALATYGAEVGLAFQIADDLLDYRGDNRRTGKPIATDFREGQATLPLIRLREKLSPGELATARRRFGGTVNEDEIRMICDWMETRGAFAASEAAAKDHIAGAKRALAELSESTPRTMLDAVADYVLRRQS